jgi:hypothetical protein
MLLPPVMEDNTDQSQFTSEDAVQTPSIQSTESLESFPDDIKVGNEQGLLTFMARLQKGMSIFLGEAKTKVRPSRYNKMGKLAQRTKRRHEFEDTTRTKAFRKEGYHDIRSFFQTQLLGGQRVLVEGAGTSCMREEEC